MFFLQACFQILTFLWPDPDLFLSRPRLKVSRVAQVRFLCDFVWNLSPRCRMVFELA